MLRKLMKHEFRATGRIMLPVFLLVLISAVGANLSTKFFLESDSKTLNIFGFLFMTAFALAIAAVCFVSVILMIQRFYKNLMQDEGYVMMTLPVSVHQHIISKLLVSMVWFILTVIVVILGFIILAYDVGLIKEILSGARELMHEAYFSEYLPHAAAYIVEFTLLAFFSAAASCLQFYLAIAIGHSFSSHKLIMSVAAYFAINLILEAIGLVLLSSIGNSTQLIENLNDFLPTLSNVAAAHVVLIGLSLMSLVYAAIFYFPTAWFMKHKLNLE